MEEAAAWLKTFGLNDTEIKVYQCILSRPEIGAAEVQRQTGLVRTTIYYSLAQLKTLGLISENLQNNIKSYRAADISILRHSIEANIAEQQQSLGQLEALKPLLSQASKQPNPPDSYVARFEGIGPIEQVIEEALRCNSKRWQVIASRDNFLYHATKQYQRYYLNERKRRGIIAKTLWEPSQDTYVPSLEDTFFRNPRRLPNEFQGVFNALVIIYDDTTLFIDPYNQKTAHAVHSQTSTRLLSLLHEHVWHTAAKIK